MTKAIVALGIAVMACGCASSRPVSTTLPSTPPTVVRATPATTPLDPDRMEIYQRVIHEIVPGGRAEVRAITSEIRPADPESSWKSEMDGLVPRLRLWVDQETITDWLTDSSTAHSLAEVLEGTNYVSVAPGVCNIACLNGEVISVAVSGIGLNGDRTRALVWITYSCGSLCGDAYYAVFEKHEGAWRITILDPYPYRER